MSHLHIDKLAVAAAAALICGGFAQAQSLIQTNATVVAALGDVVPGGGGALFGGSGDFDNPVIDENGFIVFRAKMVGTGTISTVNDRAIFRGSNRGDLVMLARGQDPAPGMFGGETLGTPSLSVLSSCRVSPNGMALFGSTISGGSVTGTTNDSAWFGGPAGSIVPVVREGDPAPGTVGATLTQSFSSVTQQTSAFNRNGHIFFTSTLANGDVVGTTNNNGFFAGPVGGLQLVLRKGDNGPGAPGDTVLTGIGFLAQMNDSGQIFYDTSISTTLGATPATTANDKAYYIYTPGFGSTLAVREGQAAPGTAGALFNASGNNWSLAQGASNFTNTGKLLAHAPLFSGDVTGTSNDRALYFFSASGATMVMREGDPAPGTDANFDVVNDFNTVCNNFEKVAIMAQVVGGTATAANDAGLWTGPAGGLQLVAREGDPAPGTVGATLGINISQSTIMINDRGQIVFPATLVGGDVVGTTNDTATYVWDPVQGLLLVARKNDSIEVQPTVFDTITSNALGVIQFTNNNGRALSFSQDGKLCVRANTTGGIPFVAIIDMPQAAVSFCSGDGSLTDHTTPCPCGNNGAPGNGCAHSFDANGANLAYTGSSIQDTMALQSTFTPANAFTLFMQHDAAGDTTFHDGVLCAGGTLIRLRGRNAVVGASSFPNPLWDSSITLSQRGLVTPGSGLRRYYSAFYRNASTTFCPPATANVTNGLRVDW